MRKETGTSVRERGAKYQTTPKKGGSVFEPLEIQIPTEARTEQVPTLKRSLTRLVISYPEAHKKAAKVLTKVR